MPTPVLPRRPDSTSRSDVHEIIRRGAVRAVYQPIVDLASGEPVGYEALARGPEGSPLESPLALFAAARDVGDPLLMEWNVVVIAPHFAAAFVGRDCGDGGTDMQRRFDFALTHDRALAVQAAESLTARITPQA